MADDIEFVPGMIVKEPHKNAPPFVICQVAVKRKELGNFLRSKDEDWINMTIKKAKSGKLYIEVDNWKPGQ